MKIRGLILCLVLLPGTPLFARESTDEIVMNNGDKLTGTVKGVDAGVLYFSLPYAIETISIDWSKVVSLHSQQLFWVKLQDGSVYTGTVNSALTTPGGPNKPEVVDPQGNQILIDSSQIMHDLRRARSSKRNFRFETNGYFVHGLV